MFFDECLQLRFTDDMLVGPRMVKIIPIIVQIIVGVIKKDLVFQVSLLLVPLQKIYYQHTNASQNKKKDNNF